VADLDVKSYGNAILLPTSPNNRTAMLRNFIIGTIIMLLLCYIVKHFFYIPPILMVWRRTTSQIRLERTATVSVGLNFFIEMVYIF
jgi:hypothetical protein